jgi:hypothetical protein
VWTCSALRASAIAALYTRKSTKQARDAEDKSVATQVDNARAFAAARGWTVDEAHIYIDDAISGTETVKLANRKRCLDAHERNYVC